MAATIRIRATPKPHREGMNRLESDYADHLDVLKAAGEVQAWWYQPLKWILADRTTYTPDFLVVLPDDTAECHEAKGFMRDDANVKIKVAAAMFPFVFRLVFRTKAKGWDIRRVGG